LVMFHTFSGTMNSIGDAFDIILEQTIDF
jgi:hypothetical protein